jgi:hypothetical protein
MISPSTAAFLSPIPTRRRSIFACTGIRSGTGSSFAPPSSRLLFADPHPETMGLRRQQLLSIHFPMFTRGNPSDNKFCLNLHAHYIIPRCFWQ